MVLFLHHIDVTATTRDVPGFRYVGAEEGQSPIAAAGPCIKLTFEESTPLESIDAQLITPDGGYGGFLQAGEDHGASTFFVWIPEEYSTTPASLTVKIQTGSDQSSLWTIRNLPNRPTPVPEVKESQLVAPGVMVTGSAASGFIMQASLSANSSPAGSDWYWEAGLQSPYVSTLKEDQLSDWKIVGADNGFPFVTGSFPYTYLLDRMRLSGAVEHFVPFEEKVEAHVLADQEETTGRWKLRGSPVFTTPSGFRFRLEQMDEKYDRDPKNKEELRFKVVADPATIGVGLDHIPDRIDLTVAPPSAGVGWSPGLAVMPLLEKTSYAIWTLKKEQLSSDIDMKVAVNRRYADRKLPFDLIIPVKQPKTPPLSAAPNITP